MLVCYGNLGEASAEYCKCDMLRLPVSTPLFVTLLLLLSMCDGGTDGQDSSAQPGTRKLSSRPLYGIDISERQRYGLDVLAPFKDSLSFVILKATGGQDHVDTTFAERWSALRQHGFIRGAYHFYYVWDDPIAQAEFFVKTVGGWTARDFPPILDFEGISFKNFRTNDPQLRGKEDFAIPVDSVQSRVARFLTRVEQLTGRLPMIYSNGFYAGKYLNSPKFAQYPLWIAAPDDVAHPRLPGAWNKWALWQKGKISVRDGQENVATDLDQFHGNISSLQRFLQYTIRDGRKVPDHSPPSAPPPSQSPATPAQPGPSEPSAGTGSGPLYGIDISDNQEYKLDALRAFQDQLSFVIVKATGGETWIDKDFNQSYWQEVKSLGFTRGAYHFYYVWDHPIAQADHFVSVVGQWQVDDLPPIVDFEGHSFYNFREQAVNISIPIERVQNELLQFLEQVKSKTKRLPMIYTNLSKANKYLTDPAFAQYPLWIADPNNGESAPRLPTTWKNAGWAIWQRGYIFIPDKGSKHTDYDQFHGGERALRQFLRNTNLSRSSQ